MRDGDSAHDRQVSRVDNRMSVFISADCEVSCCLFPNILEANADVLPPGHGRAAGVDVLRFMPVGRDVLLGILEFCEYGFECFR